MKVRLGHVTNSSSSSFIITNKSNEILSSEEIARKFFEKIIEDAKDKFHDLEPGESIELICGDHYYDDGAFEYFIHNVLDNWIGEHAFRTDDVSVEFSESYH